MRKLVNSRDPEKLKQSIAELAQYAADKSDTRQYILFQLMLGEQHERSGDYALAEKCFQDAYHEAKQHLPKKGRQFRLKFFSQFSKTIFDPIDRLGYFYLTIGDLRVAEQYFNESKALREAFFPPRSIHRIHPIVGLGSWHYRKGNYETTYKLFNQASEMIDRSMTSAYDYDILRRLFLNDLTEICFALGRTDEAARYINQLAIASSGAGKFSSRVNSRLEVARIFELKARYHMLRQEYDRATEFIDRAESYQAKSLTFSDVRFRIIKTRALLSWNQGKMEEATRSFLLLVKEYRKYIANNFTAMSEYEQEQFYLLLKSDFELFNAFVLEQSGPGATTLYEEMFNNVLNTKALLLNTSNGKKNRILASKDEALIAKLHAWEAGKAKLSASFYEKTNLNTDSLERNLESLEKEINQRTGLFDQKEMALTWNQVQSALGPNEAAAELIRISPVTGVGKAKSDSVVYAMLLIRKESEHPEITVLRQGVSLEKRFLLNYRNSIMFRLEDKTSYNEFWSTIATQLKGIERFYLSRDGVYNQINLNTLQNPATNKYVIDELQLLYLTNTADLLKETPAQVVPSAVLVGRPSYQTGDNQQATTDDDVYGTRNVLADELDTFRDQDFADLPGTETEVEAISKLLTADQLKVSVLLGSSATEERIKGLEHPGILHVATHGFFVDDQASAVSPMIRSGIVLAGVKRTKDVQGEDGILTAYEATNLDLQGTSLVALSACQTGLGEVRNGEGVYGLQRAFVVAGARNLIMSLWKVDDQATATLMSLFYKAWSGNSNAMEFRKAQIEMRKLYPQPYHWGAFIMLGK
ncbi:MAG TPA: CHAT domain-containing protein [Cyclobacteriaceae bacterium]|nr:CHAT domain-containing protein [Cyclobacteriaceae bacterium]